MARSIDTIYNEIVTTSNQYTSLQDFNNSASSIQRLMMRVVATAINTFEVVLDVFKSEQTALAQSASVGTERWFVYRASIFQYDVSTPQVLQITDRIIGYETVDENLRIITEASCISREDPASGENRIFLKLAKGTAGALQPLSADELSAATSYFNDIKMAGQNLIVSSDPADKLYIKADIYFNAEFVKTAVASDVEDALNEYLTNLSFDGLVYLQKAVDAIQAVDGVEDIVLREIAGRSVNTAFDDRTIFDKEYEPSAGYLELEDESGQTLENSLTYYVV